MKKCKVSGYWSCEKCVQRGSDQVTLIEPGRTKIEIIQMKNVNASPRTNEDFLKYFSTAEKNVCDNHCKNKEKPSPFYGRIDLVKGFVMEPMHTVYGGAFLRWLNGIVHERCEGIKLARIYQCNRF